MGTAIVGTAVFCLLGLAAWKAVKERKNGKSGCGCACSGCTRKKGVPPEPCGSSAKV